MKNLDTWSRLARAAADARDDVRALIPAFDRAIGEKYPDVALLERMRDGAIRHAEALLPSSYSTGRDRWPFGRPSSTLFGVGVTSRTSQWDR